MDRYQLWTFMPNIVPHVDNLGADLVVYYCTDEFSQFSYLDGARIAELEHQLCRRADVVFTTARTLWERKRSWNPETHLALHGVEQQHFAKALRDDTPVADELASAPRPVIGFFGLIHDWIDLDLFAHLAERRPEWTIALIGKASVDMSRLERFSNVKLLGRKPYEELPRYCKAFSVGVLPFALNELTRNVNPIKLREYLSAGLPVVSTEMFEVARYVQSQGNLANACTVVSHHEDFDAAVVRALATDSADARRARSEAMLAETWERKVAALGEHIQRVRAKRRN